MMGDCISVVGRCDSLRLKKTSQIKVGRKVDLRRSYFLITKDGEAWNRTTRR